MTCSAVWRARTRRRPDRRAERPSVQQMARVPRFGSAVERVTDGDVPGDVGVQPPGAVAHRLDAELGTEAPHPARRRRPAQEASQGLEGVLVDVPVGSDHPARQAQVRRLRLRDAVRRDQVRGAGPDVRHLGGSCASCPTASRCRGDPVATAGRLRGLGDRRRTCRDRSARLLHGHARGAVERPGGWRALWSTPDGRPRSQARGRPATECLARHRRPPGRS